MTFVVPTVIWLKEEKKWQTWQAKSVRWRLLQDFAAFRIPYLIESFVLLIWPSGHSLFICFHNFVFLQRSLIFIMTVQSERERKLSLLNRWGNCFALLLHILIPFILWFAKLLHKAFLFIYFFIFFWVGGMGKFTLCHTQGIYQIFSLTSILFFANSRHKGGVGVPSLVLFTNV